MIPTTAQRVTTAPPVRRLIGRRRAMGGAMVALTAVGTLAAVVPLVAIRRAGGQVATVAVNAMTFFTPVLVSDWISIYADIIKTGRTSITVHIEVRVMRRDETREIRVTEGTFTYVRIDDKARPKPLP